VLLDGVAEAIVNALDNEQDENGHQHVVLVVVRVQVEQVTGGPLVVGAVGVEHDEGVAEADHKGRNPGSADHLLAEDELPEEDVGHELRRP
jgi:hypothetical protein